MRPRVAEDPAAVERLRALGYAAGGNAAALAGPGPADDPKQLMAFEARERDILRLFQAGDLDEARALCRKSLAERPSMSLTWTQLASIERARGALAEAVEAGRRAAALRPGDPATIALLGSVLAEAGRPDEARTALAPFLAADDPDPDLLIAEGMALAQLGRAPEALAVFDRARTLDPANAFLWVNSGTVHLMTGRLRDARQAFVGALAVDPASARAHNGLGVVAASRFDRDPAAMLRTTTSSGMISTERISCSRMLIRLMKCVGTPIWFSPRMKNSERRLLRTPLPSTTARFSALKAVASSLKYWTCVPGCGPSKRSLALPS
jgi:Flp pilus assembly protein TadD